MKDLGEGRRGARNLHGRGNSQLEPIRTKVGRCPGRQSQVDVWNFVWLFCEPRDGGHVASSFFFLVRSSGPGGADAPEKYPTSSVLWTERRPRSILQAASCGRKGRLGVSHKQSLVDGKDVLEYPSSGNLRTERTPWTSHEPRQEEAKRATVLPPEIPNKRKSFTKGTEGVKQVLERYGDLFSSRLGRTNLAKHRIDTEDAKPIEHKPYRVSAKERDIIKEQIDEMLTEGIIRPSSSPWSFPVILVKKRDGKYRFCVDYRKLNNVTVKDVYPIPRIEEVMDTLQGSTYFSAIYLRSGYWQVEVEERDKEKTAFTTAHGLYEFNVMPFGLCNAPATFERNMENMLGNLRWEICMPSHRRSNLSQRSNSSRVQHAYRLRETRGQNIRRLRSQSARQAAVRSLETPAPIHSRLQAHSEIYSSTRRNTRTHNFFSSVWSSMENAGFNYSVAVEYFKHPLISLGMMDTTCRFCGALRWKDESSGMCCSNGKVRLPLIDLPPEPLRSLLSGENSDSVHFLRNIRKYNSCFQMTSFGAENQTHSVTFPTTFSIQGQVYHRIGSLMPSENQPSRFLQIYFMGNDDADDIQTDRRCQQIQGVRRNIVQGLQRMLHQHNLLVQQFKTALENLPSDAYRVVVNADRTPPGQHPRRYNAPTADEVAVVLAGNQFCSRDIVLHQRDNLLQHVSDTHRFYDALQYPLIFWKGQEGYSFHIPQIDPNTSQPLSSKVSSMDFYGYFIMVRRNSPNVIVQFGQLFHQFLVDILGQRIILPSSFVNSPRYLAEYTQDAFCYVRKFGRPDLFITFTSNPSWEELSAALLPGQKQLDRHDITARVFRQKLVKFIGALTKGQLYGAAVAWMYSVEWQKRGLPHAHILVWLANKLRPTQIDSVICAEFPDPIQDPLLYNIVVKNMIHGPCGEYNPVSPCMKNSSCSKKYPKQFLLETQTNENGYPLYRRRAPEAGGFTAKVKIRGREEVTIDNRWVVPYSPLLSKMFCAHINVENCSSVKAIKYICKYVNKGSDQAIINLRREGRGPDPQNEVRMYQCARYISSNEAVWRLLSFPLHQRHPAVIHLAVHLENGERIYFNQNTLAHRMRNPPRTTLTAFFSLCQTDSFARTLLYPDVPQYYTWNSSAHEWRRRVQGKLVEGQPGVKRSDTIGRVYAVHVSNFECFCLRILLHNIKGPTSFAYLKIVNGSQYETFRETCAAIGLLENDNHWVVTMDEAVLCQAPTRVRQLFAILISTCTISNPQQLWITYRDEMASDILHRYQLLDSSIRKAQNIAIAVASSGIAATLLAGGRTAHSVLKLPLTFAEGQTAVCNIRKNSDKASLLRSCKLLVWDECTMAHKIALEALDRTLQDIRDDPQPMGGLVVLLAGDFRQTLPVVTRGTPADELNACLKYSYLWSHIVKMHLTVNMRVQLHNDTTAAQFADELLKIGEGQLETDSEGNIQFSNTFCQVVESSESLYEKVFPNIGVNYLSEEWLCARTILAPKNSTVLEINNTILNSIPGESKIYRSIDTMVDPDESVSYPPEFLNSLELSGTPSHKIVLKVGVPVILIRNLDPPRLCNGTRLCITQMGINVLQARILTGSFRGEEVLIPRIPIISNDLPFKFRRLQFPVMVAFAMTINKSQGQTLQVVGVHLESPCFSHGQLYVACSRVSSPKNLFVFSSTFSKTRNIVYQGAFI
ncbi:hypothetical protein LAZ67_5002546 [Cordylochernes scorpioides]|uniref:ATP-dependent DNA helicase n=1 Tax=Cordylochernes scorpioides TaxID=51811 RepID=A0ABY6KIB6_9ARAC|nr:hypothetical protein LAZ67_5002546 [Cordylochernes scorpioides]